MLQDGIRRIDNDECSEEAVEYMIRRTNAESNGYYNDQSFVNYDEAMRILNIVATMFETSRNNHAEAQKQACGLLTERG